MTPETTVYVLALQGHALAKMSAEAAAKTAQLDVYELMWALEEHGKCETDDYLVCARPSDLTHAVGGTK